MPKKTVDKISLQNENSFEWRDDLVKKEIVTSDWKCQVSFFVESESDDILYLEKFNKSVLDEKRIVIKSITYDETLRMVKQIGSIKDIRYEDKIFQEANNYIKSESAIPVDILALLIKHQIASLKVKDINIKLARCKLDDGLKRESLLMMSEMVNPINEKPQIKGKSGDDTVTEANEKYHTNMRAYGEDWKDKIYVEDSPPDGADLYIAVSGFRNWYIIKHLLEIKVPLVAIVKIEKSAECVYLEEINPTVSIVTPNINQYESDIFLFWAQLENDKVSQLYNDIAFISFNPPYRDISVNEHAKNTIYDDISFLLYDIQDLCRQHKHYIDQMKVVNVSQDMTLFNRNINLYCEIVNSIPPECVTFELILHALVEQVTFDESIEIVYKKDSIQSDINLKLAIKPKTKQGKPQKTSITQIVQESLLDEANKAITNFFDKNDKINDRSLVVNGDIVAQKVSHLKEKTITDLSKIAYDINVSQPIPQLWNYFPISNVEEKNKLFTQLREFHSCIKDDDDPVSHEILNHSIRLINLIYCKNLYEKLPTPNDCLSKNIIPNKMRNLRKMSNSCDKIKSFSFAFGDEDHHEHSFDEQKFYSISKLETKSLRYSDELTEGLEIPQLSFLFNSPSKKMDIDGYNVFEQFNPSAMLQVLNNAVSNFAKVAFKYCSVTDHIMIVFYDRVVYKEIIEDSWHSQIPSPVCLKDFFYYTLDQVYEWVIKEEKIHDDYYTNIRISSLMTSENTNEGVNSHESEEDYYRDMMLIGSLKYKESCQAKTEDLESFVKTSDTKQNSVNKSNGDASSTEKKNKTPTEASSKSETHTHKISGYNVGLSSVHEIGKIKSFYSHDGTKVNFKIEIGYNHLHNASILLTSSKHTLIMHSQYNPILQKIDDVKKIRFGLESGINITFFEISDETNGNGSIHGENSEKTLTSEQNVLQSEISMQMNVSWPNGLIIEPVWTSENDMPFYIKQFFISNTGNSDELFRIFSRGEIVIFNKNESIQIFRIDGSHYMYNKIPDEDFDKEKESHDESHASPVYFHIPSLDPYLKYEEITDITQLLTNRQYECHGFLADGREFKSRENKILEKRNFFLNVTTDYRTGEMYVKRFDGTNTLFNANGTQTTVFSDGSKLTSYWVEDEISFIPSATIETLNIENDSNLPNEDYIYVLISLVYTMENTCYGSVSVDTSTKTVSIDMPYNTSIDIDEGGYNVKVNDTFKAMITNKSVYIDDFKCTKCNCGLKSSSVLNLNSFVDNNVLFKTVDSFNKMFTIDFCGESSFDCITKEGKNNHCSQIYQEDEKRYFAFKRDFSGEEYIHLDTVNHFKELLKTVKFSRIEEDMDISNKQLTYDTIFIPITPSSAQITKIFNTWKMEPKSFKVKPNNLVHKDVKQKRPEKGFYSWMRPYTQPSKRCKPNKQDEGFGPIIPPNEYSIRIFREMVPKSWRIFENMNLGLERYKCLMEKSALLRKKLNPIVPDERHKMEITKMALDILEELFDLSTKGKYKNAGNECSENLQNFRKKRAQEISIENKYKKQFCLADQNIPKYDYEQAYKKLEINNKTRDDSHEDIS